MEASTFNQERRQAIPWILWTIWKNRNSLLYAETQESPSLLVQRTLEEAALWNKLNKAESNGGQVQADMGMPKYWFPPTQGMIKCNLHASWRSDKQFIGVAWITRNHRGDVCMHARDALVPTSDKLAAEMECLLWVLRSLRDLRIEEASIGTESQKLINAIKTPAHWPRYRCLLRQIETVCLEFTVIEFEVESRESNKVARKISTSVLRDGRLRSYLALGGPAWLHDLIQTEVIGEL
ncbi:BnaCnng43410D [Brassica napus]|uniref:BnaCnng43410D protein n=1 Tax=Brassica napus TaxID=3708 RepID=A0A078JA07_BRANA|nr:BnaCnng43410D [Brassica napus]